MSDADADLMPHYLRPYYRRAAIQQARCFLAESETEPMCAVGSFYLCEKCSSLVVDPVVHEQAHGLSAIGVM